MDQPYNTQPRSSVAGPFFLPDVFYVLLYLSVGPRWAFSTKDLASGQTARIKSQHGSVK